VQLTGRNRTINRQKLERLALEGELRQPASRRSQVFERYARMLKARAARSAFSPNAGQEIIDCGETVFALLRFSPDKNQRVLCLHNISNRIQAISLDWVEIFKTGSITLKDSLTNQLFDLNPGDTFTMQPYQVNWLERR
jgi:sucrose phosphorylase